tara:strand:- start:9 stop:452 length:444 start_codon:yes stop_codon:yes gene_type:complete
MSKDKENWDKLYSSKVYYLREIYHGSPDPVLKGVFLSDLESLVRRWEKLSEEGISPGVLKKLDIYSSAMEELKLQQKADIVLQNPDYSQIKEIFDKYKGSEIARDLGVSRQAVSKLKQNLRERFEKNPEGLKYVSRWLVKEGYIINK